MAAGEEENITTEFMPLEIVWRNPLSEVRNSLRIRELFHPDYRWAEHAKSIRARRARWRVKHDAAA